jgi:hypothetical protein
LWCNIRRPATPLEIPGTYTSGLTIESRRWSIIGGDPKKPCARSDQSKLGGLQESWSCPFFYGTPRYRGWRAGTTRLLECGRQAGGVRQLDRRALKGSFRSIEVNSKLSGSAVVALPLYLYRYSDLSGSGRGRPPLPEVFKTVSSDWVAMPGQERKGPHSRLGPRARIAQGWAAALEQ